MKIVLTLFTFLIPLAASRAGDRLYQTSLIAALLQGVYDGPTTFAQLRAHGDFGLGTLNRLDGEMLALDGKFYQIPSDGSVHRIPSNARTPFAAVTDFKPEFRLSIPPGLSWDDLARFLDRALPTLNIPYAIRIDGTFASIQVRSVPAQTQPYPPLSVAAKAQTVWNYDHIAGALVGFRCPDYTRGINVPGYHFHFLSADHTRGGHVLAIQTGPATAAIDPLREITFRLPGDAAFNHADLSPSPSDTLRQVEQSR